MAMYLSYFQLFVSVAIIIAGRDVDGRDRCIWILLDSSTIQRPIQLDEPANGGHYRLSVGHLASEGPKWVTQTGGTVMCCQRCSFFSQISADLNHLSRPPSCPGQLYLPLTVPRIPRRHLADPFSLVASSIAEALPVLQIPGEITSS